MAAGASRSSPADVLTRDIRRGCPLLVDPTGLAYEPGHDLAAGPTPEARMRHAPWQRMMRRHLTSGDVVIVDRPRLSGVESRDAGKSEGLPLVAVVGRDKVYDVPGHGLAAPPKRKGPPPATTGDGPPRARSTSYRGGRLRLIHAMHCPSLRNFGSVYFFHPPLRQSARLVGGAGGGVTTSCPTPHRAVVW